jgi:predicted Zn-dependent protease
MMVRRSLIGLAVAVAVATVGGCATPQYSSQELQGDAVTRAGAEIRGADNWVPRALSDEEGEQKVLEVYGRLLPGATQLCREIGEDECAWDIRYSADQDVNAFAAGESVILIKKGILRQAENDDEIAMVIAHEMSHHAADHISETMQNAATGAVVGAVLMGALAGAAYGGSGYSPTYTQYQVNDAMNTGMQAGAALGHLSFSKAQENEADYLAAHILHRGGYDLTKARRMWIKLGRLGTTEHGERHSFNTHPDPAERLARWDLTADEITASPEATARLIKRKPVQENTGGYVVGG